MADQLRLRLATIKEVQNGNRRHRTELLQQLQELQSHMTLAATAQSPSQNLGDGVSTDPCLEEQNSVNGSLATIANINAQMTALEETLAAEGDLLLERLAILQACRLENPDPDPPASP